MRPQVGSKAVGALCLVMAGCGPELFAGGPSGVATIECRDTGSATDAPEALVRVVPRPFRSDAVAPARPSFVEADDDLAPDPFAFAPTATDDLAPDPFAGRTRAARLPMGRPLAEDDLAPDPFAGRRTPLRKSRPLAADDLAPDPFGSRTPGEMVP
jgi:hypothetical protein